MHLSRYGARRHGVIQAALHGNSLGLKEVKPRLQAEATKRKIQRTSCGLLECAKKKRNGKQTEKPPPLPKPGEGFPPDLAVFFHLFR